MEDESLAIRNLATIVLAIGGSKVKIGKVWPLESEEVETFEVPTKDWWEQVRAKAAITDKQIREQRNKVLVR